MKLQLDFDGRRLLGARPFAVFEAKDGAWSWSAGSGFPFVAGAGDVLEEIRSALKWSRENKSTCGGAVGYFSYDFARTLEPRAFTKNSPPDELGLPDVRLVFCEALTPQTSLPQSGREGAEIRSSGTCSPLPLCGRGVGGEGAAYHTALIKIQNYIAAGDIYQANYAQRFSAPLPCPPQVLYDRLQSTHAAPFSAFLEWDDFAIVSNSPERFLHLKNGELTAQPIKGTAPRGSTREEDDALKQTLFHSEKNRAENVMIVDLMRNDLGRVCRYGSVEVPSLFKVQSLPTLHHLVSTVTGVLRPECDAVDAFDAAFPCGSITGAPKIRAMQIIDELESSRRGVSFGAIGYFGFDGDMEWNVAIRTVLCKDGTAHFHTGGGIVADSEVEDEYSEMQLKAAALLGALSQKACC